MHPERLLTLPPSARCNSDSFVTEGQWLNAEIDNCITLILWWHTVLAINLFFCASPSGTAFGQAFLQEIDLFFQ